MFHASKVAIFSILSRSHWNMEGWIHPRHFIPTVNYHLITNELPLNCLRLQPEDKKITDYQGFSQNSQEAEWMQVVKIKSNRRVNRVIISAKAGGFKGLGLTTG
jgi:hypothetical protein